MGCFGGDPVTPDVREMLQRAAEGFIKYYPGINRTINASLLPTEQAQLAASKVVTPEYARLAAQSADIANIGDISLVRGSGGTLAREADILDRSINPEFYKTRGEATNALSNLFGNLDVSGNLSGSERTEVERSVNRDNAATGNTNTGAPINTVKNAIQFGNAATNKQLSKIGALTGAISSATGLMSGGRTGFDPLKVATGKSGITPRDVSGTAAAGQQQFGNVFSASPTWATNESQRRGGLERFTQSMPDVSC